jgi:hypothetical protein
MPFVSYYTMGEVVVCAWINIHFQTKTNIGSKQNACIIHPCSCLWIKLWYNAHNSLNAFGETRGRVYTAVWYNGQVGMCFFSAIII